MDDHSCQLAVLRGELGEKAVFERRAVRSVRHAPVVCQISAHSCIWPGCGAVGTAYKIPPEVNIMQAEIRVGSARRSSEHSCFTLCRWILVGTHFVHSAVSDVIVNHPVGFEVCAVYRRVPECRKEVSRSAMNTCVVSHLCPLR